MLLLVSGDRDPRVRLGVRHPASLARCSGLCTAARSMADARGDAPDAHAQRPQSACGFGYCSVSARPRAGAEQVLKTAVVLRSRERVRGTVFRRPRASSCGHCGGRPPRDRRGPFNRRYHDSRPQAGTGLPSQDRAAGYPGRCPLRRKLPVKLRQGALPSRPGPARPGCQSAPSKTCGDHSAAVTHVPARFPRPMAPDAGHF
jgi:hypothetical protein